MQQLLSKRIRHQSLFAYVLLVFSYVMASKISLIQVQGCKKRNLTQIQKPSPKIKSQNSDFRNLDRQQVSSRCRALNLDRYSQREAIEETEAFSIDPPAIESCRAICLQVSSYLSSFSEQLFFTFFLVQSSWL